MNAINQYAPPAADLDHTLGIGEQVTVAMIESLRKTKAWVRLVSIALFIAGVFTLFAGLAVVAGAGIGAARTTPTAGLGAMMVGMGFMYLLFAVIYIILAYYLFQYSNSIKRMLSDGVAINMETALESQRKFWKVAGILVAIGFIFAVIGIVAAVAIPAFSALR
jgi:Family of unknown function (DUF5362)